VILIKIAYIMTVNSVPRRFRHRSEGGEFGLNRSHPYRQKLLHSSISLLPETRDFGEEGTKIINVNGHILRF
jgi:hypothetical protein